MAAAGRNIDIDKLMASGQVLKDDTATTVVRTTWMGRDVVVKRYNYRGILRALAGVLRGSRAKRAWFHGQLLNRIGVPTPEPLVFLETRRCGLVRKSFLITLCIDGVSFHHYIRNDNLPAAQRCRVVEQIKGIMDALARHKISHGDTKPSNFIVAGDSPVLTDLDSMKIHWMAPMAKRGAKSDLARFMTRINTDDISAEMRRLCAIACGYSGPLPYQFKNDYFEIPATRSHGWNLLVRRGFNSEDAIAIVDGGVRQRRDLANGRVCRDESRYIRVRSSKMTRVWTATAGFRGRDIRIFIKAHLHRSFIDFIKHLLRDSRGRRAFKASIMLRRNDLDCPEPLVLLEKYWGLFCTGSILVTEGIPDCIQLYIHLNRLAAEGTQGAEIEKRTIIRELGAYVGKMHRAGIFHGDLRTGNILLQHSGERWRFYLVDNERTRQFAIVPDRLIKKNLVQLNMFQTAISNTDRMRFLKAYNEQVNLADDEIRRLCKCVIRKTSKRLKIHKLHHPLLTQARRG